MKRCLSLTVVLLPLALAASWAGERRGSPPGAAPSHVRVHKDFKVELLYSVPRDKHGSWINLTIDPKGRLIVSDQYGKLYRVTPPPLGTTAGLKVEPIDLKIGGAHGLLYAYDSLYVVVGDGPRGGPRAGLYRVRDTDGDDKFDTVELLRRIQGGGEHGPHAVLKGPDGKSLYVLCGNHTKPVEFERSRPGRPWGEDHLLPRMWDANGHARGILAPGGCVYKLDPEGKNWEVVSIGYRNAFDAAFNRDGELFTFDADMEWDINTPWYRPTRVCHVVSGSDFGWRSGTGKWPVYYPDSLPPVIDIGPGSPTGMTFGYGARFPAKYQEALFMCDWSYGKLYVVHLKPEGASYTGTAEELLNGTPLPLTDIAVNAKDGAMYFVTGGRRTQSELYRLTYVGKESIAPAKPRTDAGAAARAERHKLEAFHGKPDPKAVPAAWPYLGKADRFLRYAARVAVEHQPPATWQERALAEKDPQAALEALLALARVGDKALQPRLLQALARLDWVKLSEAQKLALLRVYGLAFIRMGAPDRETAAKVIARFDPLYPARGPELNVELCNLLVYLQAPSAARKSMALMEKAPTQEEQMAYALALRNLKAGWTPELRKGFFSWFLKAANYRGGASFGGFVRNIKADAVATLTPAERAELKPILEAKPAPVKPLTVKNRPFVKKWTVKELTPLVEKGLTKRNFSRGRRLFAEALCFSCHRFANEGGAQGPDLTGAAGRFSVHDLLESIVEPSKTISDQYAASIITTRRGKVITGRIVNLHGNAMMVNTDMLDPNGLVNVDRRQVESVKPSPVSMMPEGLLDTFKLDEVLDLTAYLLSRGNRNDKMFR
jgi:putative heme-binding domain-containing protein